jgi:glutaminyl-peptide cyclotransferase
MLSKLFYFLLVLGIVSCGTSGNNVDATQEQTGGGIPEAPLLSYTILNAFPHDTAAFTQGLEFYRGELLESTGLEGRSSLRKVDLKSGQPKTIMSLDAKLFGEGITVLGDTLYQLTWQNRKVLLYDPKSLVLKGELPWSYEGWGITNDGHSLYISDGSDKLYVVSRGTLKLERVISVSDHLGPVNNLNELEYVDGVIYANRLDYNYIMRIDPRNGQVTGKIDLKDVLEKYARIDLGYIRNNVHGAVLNGIAWEPESKKMYVTGKLWPLVFELQLQP